MSRSSKKYAYWKTIAWRLVRVSLSAAIVLYLENLSQGNLIPEKEIAVSILIGSISAAGKVLRDMLGDGSKSTPIDKLPL